MWIKARDGNLHEMTGRSVVAVAWEKPGPKPAISQPPDCLAILSADGHRCLLEREVSPERIEEVRQKIVDAIATRQVLVEV